MPVTRTSRIKRRIRPTPRENHKQLQARDDLRIVAELLNARDLAAFQSGLDNLDEPDRFQFDQQWAEEAWKVREELITDLEPLIEGNTATKVEKQLEQVIEKVNDLGIEPYWDTWPATKTIEGEIGPINPAQQKLGVGQGVLKLAKAKWIVTMGIDTSESPRKYLYGTVITALQSGIFNYFKRCQWENCRKFFVASDLRRHTYCSDRCMKGHDKADAPARVHRSRDKQRHQKAGTSKQKPIDKFSEFLTEADMAKGVTAQQKLHPIVKKLGGWKIVDQLQVQRRAGAQTAEIWKNLNAAKKKVFEKE